MFDCTAGCNLAQYVLASTLAFAGPAGDAVLAAFEHAASAPRVAKRMKSLRLKAGMPFSRSITARRAVADSTFLVGLEVPMQLPGRDRLRMARRNRLRIQRSLVLATDEDDAARVRRVRVPFHGCARLRFHLRCVDGLRSKRVRLCVQQRDRARHVHVRLRNVWTVRVSGSRNAVPGFGAVARRAIGHRGLRGHRAEHASGDDPAAAIRWNVRMLHGCSPDRVEVRYGLLPEAKSSADSTAKLPPQACA